MKTVDWKPADDGITHINVYSKGKTELGRLLSAFARTPFTHPKHGHFESLEGYWYWIKTGMCHNQLRELCGYEAKRIGKTLPVVHVDDFEQQILEGVREKMRCNPTLLKQLCGVDLPLAHYYVYGGDEGKVINEIKTMWVIDEYAHIRYLMQQKKKDAAAIADTL